MQIMKHNQIDEIHIAKLPGGGYGEAVVRVPEEINRIVELISEPAEECPDYVHSPQVRGFRIELYQRSKLIERIGVTGNYLHRDNEWYFMPTSFLEEELIKCAEDVSLIKPFCNLW